MESFLDKHKYVAQYGGQIIGYYSSPECAAGSVRDAHIMAMRRAEVTPGFCGVAVGANIVLTLGECLTETGRQQ